MIAAMLLHAQAPMVTNPVAIFLVVLAIILIVPLLLQRIKLPYVIGLILAGVAVGPHGFNIVGRDMSFEVFGQVGILYLMFLAGLEIDMYHLRRNLRRGLFSAPILLSFRSLSVLAWDSVFWASESKRRFCWRRCLRPTLFWHIR